MSVLKAGGIPPAFAPALILEDAFPFAINVFSAGTDKCMCRRAPALTKYAGPVEIEKRPTGTMWKQYIQT